MLEGESTTYCRNSNSTQKRITASPGVEFCVCINYVAPCTDILITEKGSGLVSGGNYACRLQQMFFTRVLQSCLLYSHGSNGARVFIYISILARNKNSYQSIAVNQFRVIVNVQLY